MSNKPENKHQSIPVDRYTSLQTDILITQIQLAQSLLEEERLRRNILFLQKNYHDNQDNIEIERRIEAARLHEAALIIQEMGSNKLKG